MLCRHAVLSPHRVEGLAFRVWCVVCGVWCVVCGEMWYPEGTIVLNTVHPTPHPLHPLDPGP